MVLACVRLSGADSTVPSGSVTASRVRTTVPAREACVSAKRDSLDLTVAMTCVKLYLAETRPVAHEECASVPQGTQDFTVSTTSWSVKATLVTMMLHVSMKSTGTNVNAKLVTMGHIVKMNYLFPPTLLL